MDQLLNTIAVMEHMGADRVLCVDLDSTLIHSDLLLESALALLSSNPLMAFAMREWLLRGKAYLKQQIAQRVTLTPQTLPYNEPLLAWLRTQGNDRSQLAQEGDHDQCHDQPSVYSAPPFRPVAPGDRRWLNSYEMSLLSQPASTSAASWTL